MSIRGIPLVRVAGVCMILAAMFAFVHPAGAALITTSYVYNWDGAWVAWTSGQTPNNKDNWTGTAGSTTMSSGTTFGSPASWYITSANTTVQSDLKRQNNANWSYSIPSNATRLILELKTQGAMIGSGGRTATLFTLIDSTGAVKLGLGGYYNTTAGIYYKWAIVKPGGTNVLSTATATNVMTQLLLDIDLTANSGAGSGTLYAGGVAVGGLQNINLDLTPNDWSNWTGIRVQAAHNGKLEDLTIRWVPEPAAMSLLAVGGIGIVLRRRRGA